MSSFKPIYSNFQTTVLDMAQKNPLWEKSYPTSILYVWRDKALLCRKGGVIGEGSYYIVKIEELDGPLR
jgi:hypothetical protein